MEKNYQRFGLASGVITMALGFSTSVVAETINCTAVTTLPATIATQGVYCLTGNLGTGITSGNAINITANNVLLDLNGWKVGGQAAGTASTAVGIRSSANNVTVKNGIVRGFSSGIWLSGRGSTVEGITADQNLSDGIVVEGQGSIVSGNQVVDTGGSTSATDSSAIGITVDGSESLVKNNVVSGLTATGDGDEIGILTQSGVYSTIISNTVSDAARPSGAGTSWGILVNDVPSVGVLSNTLHDFDVCIDYASVGTGIYARNTAIYCGTTFSGGTAGSGNAGSTSP